MKKPIKSSIDYPSYSRIVNPGAIVEAPIHDKTSKPFTLKCYATKNNAPITVGELMKMELEVFNGMLKRSGKEVTELLKLFNDAESDWCDPNYLNFIEDLNEETRNRVNDLHPKPQQS